MRKMTCRSACTSGETNCGACGPRARGWVGASPWAINIAAERSAAAALLVILIFPPLLALCLEQQRGELSQILPPERPHVRQPWNFEIRHVAVLRREPILELPVRADQTVFRSAGD